MAAKLKKGDKVVVLAGRDKGKEGEITKVMPAAGKAIVAGVNMVIRHTRQSQQEQGGRIPKEAAIDLSNLAMVGFKMVDGQKVRFAKKSGEVIDA